MPITKQHVIGAAIGIAGTMYIDADGGGNVAAYAHKYDELLAKNEHVVVRGQCYSSCTMVLGYSNACLEPSAVLGFHPSYVPYLFGLFHYVISPGGTKMMRDHYPKDAQDVIDRHHGLDDKGGWMRPAITKIPAIEFPSHYQCG